MTRSVRSIHPLRYSRRWRGFILCLCFCAHALAGGGFSAERWETHVRTLASPELEGRALGSKGAAKAAAYVESQFRNYGLAPVPNLGYRESFPVALDVEVNDASAKNALNIAGPGSFAPLTLNRDYQPLSFSASGKCENAALVFAGYAISAPELDYDDFAGIDVRGKVVVAFRREPQETQPDSRFRGLDFTPHASFAAKAREVAKRGGLALLIVNNRLPDEENDDLPQFSSSSGPETVQIPVLLVRAPAIAPFFVEQGLDLASLSRTINKSGQPQSLPFRPDYRVSLRVSMRSKSAEGVNVLAWKPGSTNEYVIVGAHYDHIGYGKRFSMDPGDKGKVHPGADDNASGVAAMLELARLVSHSGTPQRGILFVAFAGEEHGLFGSTALLHNPPSGLGRLTGMINFDMVGRMRENELFVAGLESVPALGNTAMEAAKNAEVSLQRITDYPYNMSDHGTFLEAGVPAVLFFTGLHMEYHTARDTANRVSSEGAMKVLAVAYEILRAMANSELSLIYQPGMDPGYERKLREIAAPSNPYNQE